MSDHIQIGIDLGTTNSGIASFINGHVVVHKNPRTGKDTIASIVAFRKDRVIVGEKARELIEKDPLNVFGAFKRKMGTDHTYRVQVTGQEVSPVELSTILLREMRDYCPDEIVKSSAVITIPAAFDTVQSNATKQAGADAGFHEVVLLQEPIAASIAYANEDSVSLKDCKWIVYDLGGGTFDVALMTIDQDEMRVLDHEGDNYLGGHDMDKALLFDVILPKLRAAAQMPHLLSGQTTSLEEERLYHMLMMKAEEAKKDLTSQPVITIDLDLPLTEGSDEYSIEVTRQEFEACIGSIIERTIKLTKSLLQSNALEAEGISNIFLVGGSTFVPAVRDALIRNFDTPVSNTIDPTTAVMIGAAYYAGTRMRKVSEEPLQVVAKQDSAAVKSPTQLEIKLAHNRMSAEDQEILLVSILEKDAGKDCVIRVTRSDGGYDSGMLQCNGRARLMLPLVPNVLNSFSVKVYSAEGAPITSLDREVTIQHGKYSISGQPLPADICLEVDSPEDGQSYLEPVFRKNDVLPLRFRTNKQLVRTIRQGSNDAFSVTVYEGPFNRSPEANKKIGRIVIAGKDLERDIVKGSDIELEFEMSESRDLTVKVLVGMTDQEFSEVFSPSQTSVDLKELGYELDALKSRAQGIISTAEREEDYERAAQGAQIREKLKTLEDQVRKAQKGSMTEDKYEIETHKRQLAVEMEMLSDVSLLTKLTGDWYEAKQHLELIFSHEAGFVDEKRLYEGIIADEKRIIASGSVRTLRDKVNRLEDLKRQVHGRRKLSYSELLFAYTHLKGKSYRDKRTANAFIAQADAAIESRNEAHLYDALVGLSILYQQENPEDASDTFSPKTGIR